MAMTRFGTMAAALATVAILAGCGGGGGSPGGEPRMEPAPKPQPKEPEAELRGTRIAEISGVIDSLDDVDTFEAPVTGPGLLVIGISNEDFNVRVLTPDGQEIPTYRGSFLANINDAIWEAVTEKAGEAADEVRESRPVKFLVEVAARGKRAVGRAYSAEVDYVTDIGIICTEYGLPEAEAVTVCNTGSVAPPEPSVVLPEPKKNLGQIRQMAVNRGHHSHLGEGAAVARASCRFRNSILAIYLVVRMALRVPRKSVKWGTDSGTPMEFSIIPSAMNDFRSIQAERR